MTNGLPGVGVVLVSGNGRAWKVEGYRRGRDGAVWGVIMRAQDDAGRRRTFDLGLVGDWVAL